MAIAVAARPAAPCSTRRRLTTFFVAFLLTFPFALISSISLFSRSCCFALHALMTDCHCQVLAGCPAQLFHPQSVFSPRIITETDIFAKGQMT
jgi:hypothetical protein